MKSEHRHELETNVLAKRLDAVIEQLRPYAATIAGVIVALVVVMFLWSYLAGSSSARRTAAWDEFNLAVVEATPDIEQLRQVAQDHPGTELQQMADVAWADAQVFSATQNYIYNRAAAMESLTKATSAYEGVIQSSDDDRQRNRAQLGLARVYELQGKLDAAREAYLKVGGGYQQYAKMQADRLAKPEAKETYAWLESARPALPRAPWGPGTPGERPAFSEDELALPGADGAAGSTGVGPTAPAASIEELLRGLELDFETPATEGDRYAPGSTPSAPAEGTPGDTTPGQTPGGEGETPADNQTAPHGEGRENATGIPSSSGPSLGPGEDDVPANEAPSAETNGN
jgi:hypothetical protein